MTLTRGSLGGVLFLLAAALPLSACGQDKSSPGPIRNAATKTAEAKRVRLSLSGSIERAGERDPVRYSAQGTFDYARRAGRFRFQPLRPGGAVGLAEADVRGELILERRTAYVRSRAIARAFRLDRREWRRIPLHPRVETQGIDFSPIAETINGLGLLRRLRATRGSPKRLGQDRVGGVHTTRYRTTLKQHQTPSERVSVPAEVWVDDGGFVRRIEHRVSYGSPKWVMRGTQRVEFHDLGVPNDTRKPSAPQASGPVAASVASALREARRFRGYRLYFAGTSYRGLPLRAVVKSEAPIGPPGLPGEAPARSYVSFSFIYGSCEPPRDPETGLADGGCGPPLEIRNGQTCALPPGSAAAAATLRGVPASIVGEGATLYTGTTSVVLFTTGVDVKKVAAGLRSLDGTVSAGQRLPKPAPGALEGRLRCPE